MALFPFINEIKDKMRLDNIKPSEDIFIFDEAEKYIRHTVWRMLDKAVDKHEHLSFLSDAINDKDNFIVNMTTLNHDLLIEKHLVDNNIDFHDGFDAPINGVRYWENHFFDKNNLLKVHGSINWFNLKPDAGNWFDEQIGIVVAGTIDNARSQVGGRLRITPEKEPQILVGTFNKVYEYTERIFDDIYYQFRTLLSRSKRLVISGYSFGDKGVNNAILEWLYMDRQNKIVVIHPDPGDLLTGKARMAIRKAYDGIAKSNFVSIPSYIEDTSWKDIKVKVISTSV
jgi:hypothetical protein